MVTLSELVGTPVGDQIFGSPHSPDETARLSAEKSVVLKNTARKIQLIKNRLINTSHCEMSF
jgi:hypothetical protein